MYRFWVVALLVCSNGVAENLPMFRGGLEHSGVYECKAPRATPAVKWRFQTGGYVISSPAVAGQTVYAGSMDQNLYAIDRETGKVKWTFKTESAVASSPAVSGGMVYFGSYDGNFYGVDAASGQQKWKFETGGERRFAHRSLHGLHPAGETMPDPWDFYLSSPAVFQGKVYFGSGDGYVYALDAVTGLLKWRVRTGDVVHASPAVAEGTVFVGGWDGSFYAFEAASGKVKWRFQAGTDPQYGNQQGFQSSPAVSGGVVYTGCRDSKVYAIDAKTGAQKWAFSNEGSWVLTSPAVYDGAVYFGTSDTGLLHVVEAKTGAKVHSQDMKFPVYSSPAIAGGALYVGTTGGKFLAMDLKTHQTLWEFQTEASKRNLAAYSKADGKIDFEKMMSHNFYEEMVLGVAKLFTTGSILSSPAIESGEIYFGSTDGYLYALK